MILLNCKGVEPEVCIPVPTKYTQNSNNYYYYCLYWKFVDYIFNICRDCLKMASIPHGAFAACKIRSSKDEMLLARIQSIEKQEPKKFDNKEEMQYTPVKYNSKLMNSIWGLYNRYSPHNIKSNDDNIVAVDVTMQQCRSFAAYTITQKITIGFGNGDEWNFPGKATH